MALRKELRKKRHRRISSKVQGTALRPRISVFRSNRYIYTQLIDDSKGAVLAHASSLGLKKSEKGETFVDIGRRVGEDLAKKALKMKIKAAVFDRSGYKYHGVIKAVADGARKGGLKF